MDFDKPEFDAGVNIGREALSSRSMSRAISIWTSTQSKVKMGTQEQAEAVISRCAGMAYVLGEAARVLIEAGILKVTGELPDGMDVLSHLLNDRRSKFFAAVGRVVFAHKDFLADVRGFDYGPFRQVVVSTSAAREIRYGPMPHAIKITLPGRTSITAECPAPPGANNAPVTPSISVERSSSRAFGKSVSMDSGNE